MTVTAVINQKGSVGKTTDVLNLGGALAEHGRRVLLIDLDPQGNLSNAVKVEPLDDTAKVTLPDLLVNGGDPREIIVKAQPDLDLVPANLDMFLLPPRLRELDARETRLRRLLTQVADDYDNVLIDCRPAIDADTNVALAAAHDAVIPIDVDTFSIKAVKLLLAQTAKLMGNLNRPPMPYRGMVINRVPRPLSDFNQSVYDALFDLPSR